MGVEQNLALTRKRKEAILTGDAAKVAKQRESGKLIARDRVEKLLDAGSFVELDALAGKNGKSGVITGYGLIDGRPVYVWSQDFTVMGGSVGVDHARKIVKVLELAKKTGAPVISMSDSGGARLEEGVDALNGYSEVVAKMATLSGVVPQLALILGPCAGGAVITAALSDIVLLAKGIGRIVTAGPQVVSATTGKNVDIEALGGAKVSSESGTAHIVLNSEDEVFAKTREIISLLPSNNLEDAPFDFALNDDLNRELSELNEIETISDIRTIMKQIADNGVMVEIQSEFAKDMVVALARLGGRTIGFVGNQPAINEGRLTSSGSSKAARFIRFCDCYNIPVVSLVDTSGFAIASASEQGNLIRSISQLTYAYSDATCPKVSVIVGKAIGAAYVAMASKGTADVTYAWPGSVIAPMGAPAAVQILYCKELDAASDPIAKRAELEADYATKIADGINAAEHGYIDDVIEPAATRQMLAAALELLVGKREVRPSKKHGNMPL